MHLTQTGDEDFRHETEDSSSNVSRLMSSPPSSVFRLASSHASRYIVSKNGARSALFKTNTTFSGFSFAMRCIQPMSSSCGSCAASKTTQVMSVPAALRRAMRFKSLPSVPTALWRPGVSRRTSCPRGSATMPRTVFLVVCSTGETIETFSPTRRLTSVDFPAFVRPTTPTTATLPIAYGTGKLATSSAASFLTRA